SSPGWERLLTGWHDAVDGDGAADEDCVRPRQVDERGRRRTGDDLQPGDTKRARVASDPVATLGTRFDGDRPAGWVHAHPLDSDAPGARADVPEQLARHGPERGQSNGANLVLGDLPVLLEGAVRQARGAGQQHRVRVGHTL